jgi:peptidoglycan/xylan/chitin deacetylase (PgdA/CDA1 family)
MRDVKSLSQYGDHILGVRFAIPEILKLFRNYSISATWATVGMLAFSTRNELCKYLPEVLPCYINPSLDPYSHLDEIGVDEKSDPYHFGYSLLRMIQDTANMEIGSHTFSHFYCLEPRLNHDAFSEDLKSSVRALNRLGINPVSLIYPRNQYDDYHLDQAWKCGFKVFRGNPSSFLYSPQPSSNEFYLRRLGRLADAYFVVSGPNISNVSCDIAGLVNVQASRFLRPYSCLPFENVRLNRILSSMEFAAQKGTGFHLWWHPHNFGVDLKNNLKFLTCILNHYKKLEEKYGMKSLTMSQASEFI